MTKSQFRFIYLRPRKNRHGLNTYVAILVSNKFLCPRRRFQKTQVWLKLTNFGQRNTRTTFLKQDVGFLTRPCFVVPLCFNKKEVLQKVVSFLDRTLNLKYVYEDEFPLFVPQQFGYIPGVLIINMHKGRVFVGFVS